MIAWREQVVKMAKNNLFSREHASLFTYGYFSERLSVPSWPSLPVLRIKITLMPENGLPCFYLRKKQYIEEK